MEGKLTKVETELFEANADLRKLATEDAEVLRVSGTSRVGLDGGRFQEPKTLKVMLDVQERPKEVLKGARGRFGRRASEGEQGSVSSAGWSQKMRKAVVRKGSADTQECEPCQLDGRDVDMDENKGELSFIPRVVSSSTGWHEAHFMFDRQCG